MTSKKNEKGVNPRTLRRASALKRLTIQLESGSKIETESKKIYVESQIGILNDRLNGIKKRKKKNRSEKEQVSEEKDWVIDIYNVVYGYAKRSERRKTKGKSRKSLKRTKNVSLLKTVKNKPGLITAYRDGKMGVSPKNHKFILRKIENFS